MNIRFSGFSNSLQSLNRRQSLTNILLNKQNVGQSGKKDLFVRSTTYDAGTYTISAGQRRKMIPGSVLAAMNNDISKVRKQGDIYKRQTERSNHTRNAQIAEASLRLSHTLTAQYINQQHPKHQRSKGIHSVVAADKTFRKCHLLIGRYRRYDVPLRFENHA